MDIENMDLKEINQRSLSHKDEKLEDEDFKEELFYEGRAHASIMTFNENNSLRELVKIIIYSYGFEIGYNNDASLSSK